MNDNGFQIGEPIEAVPGLSRGKYRTLWEAVAKLEAGQILPVTFPDVLAATRLVGAGSNRRRPGVKIQRRGAVVYFSKETSRE